MILPYVLLIYFTILLKKIFYNQKLKRNANFKGKLMLAALCVLKVYNLRHNDTPTEPKKITTYNLDDNKWFYFAL